MEFKFPVNWFKPPFTEFVLVSKEELSDDEWKIVFDPLVKKGVSNIEATIKSDTQFQLLQEIDYGYESDDDDDYLPDSLREEEIIEEVVEVPKPTFTPSENQKSLLKILNKAFNDRGWNETGLQPTRFQWIMDKAKFDGIARRRPQFRKLLASLRDANMITIEKYDGTHGIHAIYSPIEMIEEKEDERLGRIKHTDKFEEFVAFNPSIFNAETFESESDDYDKTYGKKQGAIRRRLKNKIMGQAIVGTKKGQWSARKSQELKKQYEEACEKKGLNAYKGKKTEKQKDLSKWSKQDWTTKSGKPSSKTGERYLPAKAIKALTDKEYKKTSDKKRKDSKKGKQFSDQPKSIADKVAKYRAESSNPHSVTLSRSSNSEKKLMAVFEDSEGKKIKTTHFGQRGASDYTKHGEKERMERYLERHGGGTTTSTKEDWKDPTTAGALSRWILWNKPSLKASFDDYKSRFGLKGSINVSKSAETFEARDTSWCVNHGWIHNTKIGDIISCTSCNDMICEGCRCGGCGNCQTSDCCECKNAENEVKCKSCEKPATNVVQEGSFCFSCLPINLGAENESKFPTFQFAGSVLLVSLLPLFLDNRRDKV